MGGLATAEAGSAAYLVIHETNKTNKKIKFLMDIMLLVDPPLICLKLNLSKFQIRIY
jgi:hypothetical protein